MELDVSEYVGIGQFGRAYEIMLRNDCHAPGSVDGLLLERMIRLCPETADYLYREYTSTEAHYKVGSWPVLEGYARDATEGCPSAEEKVRGIARFCASLGERATQDLDEIRVGGQEEEITRRGSDWCTDVSRVGCLLCQATGIASRMVYLFDTEVAHWGHTVIEAHRQGVWGVIDPVYNVIYHGSDGRPGSTWELMNDRDLILAHSRPTGRTYTTPGSFRAGAVSNYFISDRGTYDYTVSGLNAYCRSVNEMADKGWPGGLRWLHGEDTA